ncbi:MAG: hypothetical protein LBC85_07730, partial [Fibromonadaceae bacterium]|nr:hypothetical protein [Fibromonadaceae bacterium]
MNTQNAKTTQAGKALMRFTLLCVVFLLGLALIISCSLGGEEETSPSSSSAIRSSSSSGIPSSSSSIDCSTISSSSISEDLCLDFDPDEEVEHHGKMKKQFCDERDGKKYVYVQIGEQTWMAENLNYDVCGSKCGEGSRLVDA